MSSTACPLCHHPVRCVLTEAGQRLFVDPVPDELGTIVRVELPDYRVRGHVLDGKQMPWLGDVNADAGPFALHTRSCGRRGRARKVPCCSDCGGELHPIIVARGGSRHWLCGGAPRPALVPAGAPDNTPEQLDLPEAS